METTELGYVEKIERKREVTIQRLRFTSPKSSLSRMFFSP
jgi:hypothetical protein